MKEAKQPKRKFPYVADPDVQQIVGTPNDCEELVNRWGTYEVQATQGYPAGPHRAPADPWHGSGPSGD